LAGTRLRPVGEGGHIIEDEGVPLAQQPALNFLGAGVTAADGSGKTNVTIPGGGGGGDVTFELLKTLIVPSDTTSTTITLDTPVDFADYSELVCIISGVIVTNTATVALQMNGDTDSIYSYIGALTTESPATVSGFVSPTSTTLEMGNQQMEVTAPFYMKWIIEGGPILSAQNRRQGSGDFSYIESATGLYVSSRGMTMINPFTPTQLTSITLLINGGLGEIGQNTKLTIYGKKLVGSGGGGGGHVIEDEGTPLAQRADLNFVGGGVTATDAGGKTVVTIPGGSGGGIWELLDSETLLAAVNSVNLTFPSESLTTPEATKYVIIGSCQTVGAEELRWEVNGNDVDGYDSNQIELDKAVYTKKLEAGEAAWLTGVTANTPNSFHFELTLNAVSNIGGSSSLIGHLTEIIEDSGAGMRHTQSILRYSNAISALTSFRIFTETGSNFQIGSTFAIYKVSNTAGGAGGGGHVIEDEGTPLAQRADMNFVGSGVTAADVGGKTEINIPGGGGLWELVDESSLVGLATKTLTLNTPISNFIKLMIIVNGQFTVAQDDIEIIITDDGGNIAQVGSKAEGAGALTIDDRELVAEISSPIVMAQNEPTAVEVVLYGHVDVNGKLIGYSKWTGQSDPSNDTYHVVDGVIAEPSGGTGTIGDIIVQSGGGAVFGAGSFVRIYQMNVASGGAGGGGHIIEDEGTPLAQRADMNFVGGGVEAIDSGGKTVININGSNAEFLGETTLGAPAQPITVTFDAPRNLADYAYFEAVFVGTMNTSSTSIGWRINGIGTGYQGNYMEWIADTNTITAGGKSDTTSIIIVGLDNATTGFSRLIVQGMTNVDGKIFMQAYGQDDSAQETASQNYGYLTTAATTISSIEMNGLSEDFAVGAKVIVFGYKKTGGTGGAGGGGHTIEDEGTPLAQRADLNFVGAGVTAADAGGKTVVTIPGITSTADVHVEKLAEVTQGADVQDLTASFTARNLSDYSHFLCQFAGTGNSGDSLGWAINGIFAGYKDSGSNAGGAVDAGAYAGSGPIYSVCQINGYAGFDPGATKKTMLLVRSYNDSATPANLSDTISGSLTTPTQTQLSSVTVRSQTEFVGIGSKLTIWGYKLTPVGVVGVGNAHVIEDEGTPVAQQPDLNFVGDGVTVTDDIPNTATVVTIQGGHSIENEGVPLAQQPTMNFVGAGVDVTDAGGKTLVTIAGGGGGGGGDFNPFTIEPETYHWFFDEFFYPDPVAASANWHWEQISTGAVTISASLSTIGGAIQLTTGANANDRNGIRTCGGGLVAVDSDSDFKIAWTMKIQDGQAGGATRMGLFASGGAGPAGTYPFSSEPTPYIWFAEDGSGNWLAQTHNSTTPVSIDTGVAYDQNVYHTFTIEFARPAAVPTITWYIDGLLVATSTANIPDALLSMGIIHQTDGIGNRVMEIDTALIVNGDEPAGGGGGGGHVIEDEGTPVAQRANLNFIGSGVAVTDNDPDTDVTITNNVVGSVIVSTPVNSVDIVLTETIPFDGTIESLELVGTLSYVTNPDVIRVRINNDVGAVYDLTLVKVSTAGVVTGSHVGSATSWSSGETVAIGGFMSMIRITMGIGSNMGGDRPAIEFFETCGGPPPPSTIVLREGRGIHQGSIANITSIQVFSDGENFVTGSQFTVRKKPAT